MVTYHWNMYEFIYVDNLQFYMLYAFVGIWKWVGQLPAHTNVGFGGREGEMRDIVMVTVIIIRGKGMP
jgi:hypothetical protein